METRIETFKDKSGHWRWRLIHANGNIMADSSEGYANKSDMLQSLEHVRGYMEHAVIKEVKP